MNETIPPLLVQRMGKLHRIVYAETRNLARLNNGEAVDEGGFEDSTDAQIHLSKVVGSKTQTDPEAEGIGNA